MAVQARFSKESFYLSLSLSLYFMSSLSVRWLKSVILALLCGSVDFWVCLFLPCRWTHLWPSSSSPIKSMRNRFCCPPCESVYFRHPASSHSSHVNLLFEASPECTAQEGKLWNIFPKRTTLRRLRPSCWKQQWPGFASVRPLSALSSSQRKAQHITTSTPVRPLGDFPCWATAHLVCGNLMQVGGGGGGHLWV